MLLLHVLQQCMIYDFQMGNLTLHKLFSKILRKTNNSVKNEKLCFIMKGEKIPHMHTFWP